MKNFQNKHLLLLIVLMLESLFVFAQNDTIKIPPPPAILGVNGESWDGLSKTEQQMFLFVEKTLQEGKNKNDSCLEVLINYLVTYKNSTNYQVSKSAKLIYQIPGKKSLHFLLNNIDYFNSFSPERFSSFVYKDYPFCEVFLNENKYESRTSEIIELLIGSNLILNECDIKGVKLKLFKKILQYYFDNNSIRFKSFVNFLIEHEKDSCKINNLKRILNDDYPFDRKDNTTINKKEF
jgi:hypothetical protein